MNSICSYDFTCNKCKNNASVINGVCQCKNNYYGYGYYECIINECQYANKIFGQKKLYNCCNNKKFECSDIHIIGM